MIGATQESKELAIMHGAIAAGCVKVSQFERAQKHLFDIDCVGLTA